MLRTPKAEIFQIEIEEHELSDYDTDAHETTEIKKEYLKKTEEHWHEEKVQRLLGLYLKYVDDFLNPAVKKKSLWERIGQKLGVHPEHCDKKFRNLKHRYISLLNKKREFGTYIRWSYFDIFEKINKNNRLNIKFNSKPYTFRDDVQNQILLMNNGGVSSTDEDNASFCLEQKPPRRKRRFEDFENITRNLKKRQNILEGMELKLDRLVNVMEDSNNIQKERNKLLQQYLRTIRLTI